MNFMRCRMRVVANCVLALRAFIARPDTDRERRPQRAPSRGPGVRKRSSVILKRVGVMPKVLEKADALYESYKIEDLYNFLLDHKDVSNDEIQWRLARATYEYAQHQNDPSQKRDALLEAFSYAEKALDLNQDSPHCHRWYGALLHFTTENIGIKNKIATAYEVREHFDRALELDPNDVISVHSIGYWCYAFAERPWYQKKIASAVFMPLPDTTFEDALEWFLKAEEMENVMVTNSLMIAKSYLHLKDKQNAVKYLKKAADMKAVAKSDMVSQKEAKEKLKSMGFGHYVRQCE